VKADKARDVGAQQQADLAGDAVEAVLLRRPSGDERGDAAQGRLLLAECSMRRLPLTQRALVPPALELRRGAGGEDPKRGDLLGVRDERRGGKDAQVAMCAPSAPRSATAR